MMENVEYLLSLSKKNGDNGKVILVNRKGTYELQWTLYSMDVEETHILFTGNQQEQAWEEIEATLSEKVKEGYGLDSPLFSHLLSSLPPRLILFKKLEYFSTHHANPILFQELKKWRKETSTIFHYPPYFIGTDKLLTLLATFIPHTEEQLLQIPGIGVQKYSQYGVDILERTKKYEQPFPYPLQWIHDKVDENTLAIWMMREKKGKDERKKIRIEKEREDKLRLLEMIEDEISVEEMIQRLEITLPTLLVRMKDLFKEGYEVIDFLQKEVNRIQERELIADIANTLGNKRLKPIYEKLYGDSGGISDKEIKDRYNRIRLVCACLQLKNVE